MPARKMTGPDSRYSERAAAIEVERIIGRIGRGAQKAMALGIDLSEQQMSAKLRGVNDGMTVEQLGKLANLIDGPAGWPWVPWEESDLLAHLDRLRRKLGLRPTKA